MTTRIVCAILFFLSLSLFALSAAAQKYASATDEVCWKHTLTRPVEGIPQNCPGGQHQAGLCYPNCGAGGSVAQNGFSGVGVVCWANCPAGWSDHGAGCTKPGTYSRGAHVMIADGPRNCDAEAQGRGCEQFGLLLYPRPRPGYRCGDAGIVCSAMCPPGWHDTGLTCIKPTETRPVAGLPTCNSGVEYQAGLCYRACASGYDGVGVVCWGRCDPSHPVDCGALCGRTSADCAKAITEQVVAVLEVIGNVVSTVLTAGASTGATAGAKAAAAAAKSSGKAAIASAMKGTAKGMAKSTFKATLIKVAKDTGKSLAESTAEQLASAAAGEEFDWAALDPTGIASVVQAFNKPICLPPQQVATAGPAGGASSAGSRPNPALGPGSVIKAPDNQTTYLINAQGVKMGFVTADSFLSCGYQWNQIQTLAPQVVNAIPTGPAIPTAAACRAALLAPGSVIKAPDNQTTYLINAQGVKMGFVTADSFLNCGFQWNQIQTLAPQVVNAVPTGPAIPTAAACRAIRAAIR